MKLQAKLSHLQLLILTSSQLSLIGANIFHTPNEENILEISRPRLIYSKEDSTGTESGLTPVLLMSKAYSILPSSVQNIQNQGMNKLIDSKPPLIFQDDQEKLSARPHDINLNKLLKLSSSTLTSRTPLLERNYTEDIKVHATTTARPVYDQIPRPLLPYDISESSISPTSFVATTKDILLAN